MSDADIDDDFDDNFVDDDDAKMVEEAETSVRTRLSSLEKRRLIDNLLEEKRLAKELKDDLDDIDNFDEDGDVDKWDLAAWQLGYGTATDAEHYSGDADGDGDVDGRDFLVWQQQFGSGSLQAVTVPEPAVICLVAATLLFSGSWRQNATPRGRVC